PPPCDANMMPAGCVPTCEYHPPVGPLDAVEKYSWGPVADVKPNFTDIWSTPAVGRIYDANCDGKVDVLDPPDLVFVSGRAIDGNGVGTCCQCTGAATSACLTGVLRMLDGRTGEEIWSLDKASSTSVGFAGLSVAIGDIDNDGRMDITAVTGEGYVVLLDATGAVLRTSDLPIPGHGNGTFGWGGGLAIADMDHDGFPEIAYGPTVFTTTNGAITLKFTGTGGIGGGAIYEALSTFVDLDGAADGNLELLAGRTAYNADGSILWNRSTIADGFPAVGDFEPDGTPDVVLVAGGQVTILDGPTGATVLGPVTLPGNGFGGPPTVADFDGDGLAEIGVAQQNKYTVLKPNFVTNALDTLWAVPNHDLSSSVTGSSVFDFEGDGRAEVVYADECFLWVFDGQTGAVRFAAPHTSFTATESSFVADVDGDGHSELFMVSNGADPSNAGWKCLDANGNPSVVNGVAWTPSTAASKAYRGLTVFGDKANAWVGTRTLWNEHTYHVSNVCDDRDSACDAPNVYGSIPTNEKNNWDLPWLNNFRQNVQDQGIFNAPDATVSLAVPCVEPVVATVSVRNLGLASLPAGVTVGVYKVDPAGDVLVGQGSTANALFPGQTSVFDVALDTVLASKNDTYVARIIIDPMNITFHECREDNNESAAVKPSCVQ
ncbi:MAG TPA: VCBS repeat-containing protein, partial [Polyangiaceae bacterium]|nr:VCBS repeat-containing protein [Polyangiaceae bacterium]